jgi:hypothetical protein
VDVESDTLNYNSLESGTCPYFPSETFVEAMEQATNIGAVKSWLNNEGVKLNPARWELWGEQAQGAIGKLDWVWDSVTPKPSKHPNHPSAVQNKEQVGAQLDLAEAMGMVEYLPEGTAQGEFVTNILPLGARIKATGKIRILVDPSLPGVNKLMSDLPCPLPTVESIFQQCKPNSFLGKKDLESGFFHCVLSPRARRHMGFIHPVNGKVGRWVVLPQGTKQSPAFFCETTGAATRIFNKLLEKNDVQCTIVVYVDDFIFIADTHADLLNAFALVESESALLGLSWNPDKDVGKATPLHAAEILGLTIDTSTMTIHLPESKRVDYLAILENFYSEYRHMMQAPRKTVEKLLGKLIFACRVCRWGYLFVQSIMDSLYPGDFAKPSKTIRLTDAFWQDITFWREALGTYYHKWCGMKPHLVARKDLLIEPSSYTMHLYSDASKVFGVGGILNPDSPAIEILSKPWKRDVSSTHIGALELEAVYHNLVHWKEDLHGCTVLAWLDNIQAMSAINKGASRLPTLRDTLLKIALLGLEYNFDLKAKYIKGALNPADAPSRGLTKTTGQDYTFIHFHLFNNPPAEVDCCAATSGYNVQPGCTSFYSVTNPVENNIPALVGKVLWANVPFSAAENTISAIVAAWSFDPINTIATLVVPEWPEATWYRKFIRRKKPLFKLLHRYPTGSSLFTFRNSHKPAPPCKFPILVLRLGSTSRPRRRDQAETTGV